MREPGDNLIKAWSRDYNEKPFFFGQNFPNGSRLIAWTEEPKMTKNALYKILETMSSSLSVMVKISAGHNDAGKQIWTVYQGNPPKEIVLKTIRSNEEYVFSDGMHQFWIKDVQTGRYLVFEDHGIFNLYFPNDTDEALFLSVGFERRFANPIFCAPHFHCVKNNTEQTEMKFVSELGLNLTTSNLD